MSTDTTLQRPDAGFTAKSVKQPDRLTYAIQAYLQANESTADPVVADLLELVKEKLTDAAQIENRITLAGELVTSAGRTAKISMGALKAAELDEIVNHNEVPAGLAETAQADQLKLVKAEARLAGLTEHLEGIRVEIGEGKTDAVQALEEHGKVKDAELTQAWDDAIAKCVAELTPIVISGSASGHKQIHFWLADSHLVTGVHTLHAYRKVDQLLPLRRPNSNPALKAHVEAEAGPRQRLEFELRRA